MGEDKDDLLNSDELRDANAYLRRKDELSNTSLYDHFSKVLSTLLDKRPGNAIGVFEDLSLDCKVVAEPREEGEAQPAPENAKETDLKILSSAILTQKLFERDTDRDGDVDNDEELETALPNLMDLNFYFEQAAVGLSQEEMFKVWLSLKTLVDSKPLQTVRFWGKMFGLENNYYVAEVDYREGGLEEEEDEELEKEEDEASKEKDDDNDDDEEKEDEDDVPRPNWFPPPVIPKEEYRSGTNKYIYYVTTSFNASWVKLPHVTPAEIVTARQIKKFLTGRLDAPIVCYPPFPGNEANYLRAQIARITAGTHISPAGYYAFEDEEEEEEEEVRETYVINPEFEGVNPRELMDTSINSWVHHCMNILPQGRCIWHNPVTKTEDEFDDEEAEEEQDEIEEPQPESGPPLLASVNEDDDVNNLPAWSPYLSSNFLPQYAVAVMRSNRWPGAYAFAHDTKFENIYVGWGQKYLPHGYTPPNLPPVMEEFPGGADITEIDDPTVEEEQEAKARQEVDVEPGDDGDDVDDEDDDD
ncbi:radial spoke head 4 homolog A-like [Paramuricea clavata]|uniref:Radial spoke head 4 homolog A-like n=1 Tax=Paramuricea clavata TaxID=317549 RepID=A0A6S7GI51_PARCT|nr:radial spoke head 4 homolog A-like [Paramuricea clavata]